MLLLSQEKIMGKFVKRLFDSRNLIGLFAAIVLICLLMINFLNIKGAINGFDILASIFNYFDYVDYLTAVASEFSTYFVFVQVSVVLLLVLVGCMIYVNCRNFFNQKYTVNNKNLVISALIFASTVAILLFAYLMDGYVPNSWLNVLYLNVVSFLVLAFFVWAKIYGRNEEAHFVITYSNKSFIRQVALILLVIVLSIVPSSIGIANYVGSAITDPLFDVVYHGIWFIVANFMLLVLFLLCVMIKRPQIYYIFSLFAILFLFFFEFKLTELLWESREMLTIAPYLIFIVYQAMFVINIFDCIGISKISADYKKSNIVNKYKMQPKTKTAVAGASSLRKIMMANLVLYVIGFAILFINNVAGSIVVAVVQIINFISLYICFTKDNERALLTYWIKFHLCSLPLVLTTMIVAGFYNVLLLAEIILFEIFFAIILLTYFKDFKSKIAIKFNSVSNRPNYNVYPKTLKITIAVTLCIAVALMILLFHCACALAR